MTNKFPVHITPGEFNNELRSHPKNASDFSVHTTQEEFRNAAITKQSHLCLRETWAEKYHLIIAKSLFAKASLFRLQ